MFAIEKMLAAFARKKYPVLTRPHELNLFGIRNKDTAPNTFNDLLCALTFHAAGPVLLVAPGTTDAGLYYRQNLANAKGTAMLPPGHYRDLWRIGMHQGKYPALAQNLPVAVWRDNNRDKLLEPGNLQPPEMIGLNFHKAGNASLNVDNWSATCQVVAIDAAWDAFWALILDQRDNLKKETFSYTLFEWAEIE